MNSAAKEPQRGFPEEEFRTRMLNAQSAMRDAGLSALLLTTEADFRYFSGFLTRFWESPTRPWFLILPLIGKPIAVIPSIGAHLMATTWVDDIRTWQSPDYDDDGLSLLTATLFEVTQADGRIGTPCGPETHLRLPLSDWVRLEDKLGSRAMTDDAGIVRNLRMIKSSREIEKISHACAIANCAFSRLNEIVRPGAPLDLVFRRFQILCLEEGADYVPYVAVGAGRGGYHDVISPADTTPLEEGDVLMLDTGLVWDGYFCDFDRNVSVGHPGDDVMSAYSKLLEATDAAFSLAKPEVRACDLFHAMDRVISQGATQSSSGRLGHGLGSQLTEWPSLIPQDDTILNAGMVLTLEPSIEVIPGKILVHEENIVIEEDGARYLSDRKAAKLRILHG